MDYRKVIESLWCNCGLDNPEPKWHSVNCCYRAEWEDKTGSVHMNPEQLKIAEEVTEWEACRVKQYDLDFLDRIQMQRTEEAYLYRREYAS